MNETRLQDSTIQYTIVHEPQQIRTIFSFVSIYFILERQRRFRNKHTTNMCGAKEWSFTYSIEWNVCATVQCRQCVIVYRKLWLWQCINESLWCKSRKSKGTRGYFCDQICHKCETDWRVQKWIHKWIHDENLVYFLGFCCSINIWQLFELFENVYDFTFVWCIRVGHVLVRAYCVAIRTNISIKWIEFKDVMVDNANHITLINRIQQLHISFDRHTVCDL